MCRSAALTARIDRGLGPASAHPMRGPAQPTRARARSAPATLGFAPPLAAGSYRAGSMFAWASWRREVTPSFRNTLRRW